MVIRMLHGGWPGRSRRRAARTAVPAAALLLLAGCGSSGGSATTSGGQAAGASASSAVSAASVAPAASDPAPAAGGGDAAQFCAVVKQQQALVQGSELSKLVGGAGPAAWKAYFDKADAINQQLTDVAPDEIKASITAVRQSTIELRAALAAAGYDLSKLKTDQLVKSLQAPERVKATAAVVSYVKTNCKIDLSKPPS